MALRRQGLAFAVVSAVMLAAGLVAMRPTQWDAFRLIGLALALLGLVLLTIARVQLGRSFSVTPQARALVTTGLYAKIRHPVYVFGAISVAGLLMYVGRPRLLWILSVLVPLQVIRIRAESRILEEAFGEEYRTWKRQTWF